MWALLDAHLGEGWLTRAHDPGVWEAVDDISDDELWRARCECRRVLIERSRAKATQDRLRRGEDITYVEAAAHGFDPDRLTIGFARRLATYKRLYLLSLRPDRALRLLGGERPGAVRLRGEGASPRRWRKGDRPRPVPVEERARGRRSGRVPRGLRPLVRRSTGGGMRRLGQPASSAGGGERHERDEGGAERSRSTSRCSTAGGPRRTTARTDGRSTATVEADVGGTGPAPRRRAVRSARARGRPALPRTGRRRGCHEAGWRW